MLKIKIKPQNDKRNEILFGDLLIFDLQQIQLIKRSIYCKVK